MFLCVFFLILDSTKHENSTDHKNYFFLLKLTNAVFIPLINVKVPTIVLILTSRIHLMFSRVEHEKNIVTDF